MLKDYFGTDHILSSRLSLLAILALLVLLALLALRARPSQSLAELVSPSVIMHARRLTT